MPPHSRLGWRGPIRPRAAASAAQKTPPSLPNATSPGFSELTLQATRGRCSAALQGWPVVSVSLPTTPTAASQLPPTPRHCKGKRAFLFRLCPGPEPGESHRKTSHRGVKPRRRRHRTPANQSQARTRHSSANTIHGPASLTAAKPATTGSRGCKPLGCSHPFAKRGFVTLSLLPPSPISHRIFSPT